MFGAEIWNREGFAIDGKHTNWHACSKRDTSSFRHFNSDTDTHSGAHTYPNARTSNPYTDSNRHHNGF
jgi:hypothetical protein